MPSLEEALKTEQALLGIKLRTVPGLFGVPVGQIQTPNGTWVNTPPGYYEHVRDIQAKWRKGTLTSSDAGPGLAYANALVTEFKRLEGLALETGNYATVVGRLYPKNLQAASITADELAIFKDAGNKALNMLQREPQSYDDSAVDDWAEAVMEGTAILTSLKTQSTLLKVQPKLTRSDGSALSPWSRASFMGALGALRGIRIPSVCYSLAEIFTRIIQTGGAEKLNSIESQYFFPFQHGLTYALFEDQVDALDGLQKAGLFANYINKPLVPVSEKWIDSPHIVPYYSDWAQAIFEMLPISSNSGGVVTFSEDYQAAVDVYYNQTVGMSSLFSAAALFRDVNSPAAACFQYVEDPTADKLSLFYYADKDEVTGHFVSDTTARFDFIFQVAEARSSEVRGIFGHQDNFMQYQSISGDESSWDRRLSNFIFGKIIKSAMPVVSLARLLPSMAPSLSKPGIKIASATQSNYGGGK